jgi:hypothetical protein
MFTAGAAMTGSWADPAAMTRVNKAETVLIIRADRCSSSAQVGAHHPRRSQLSCAGSGVLERLGVPAGLGAGPYGGDSHQVT